MYESYWNLSHRPFEAKVDGRSYFPSESHQAAALKLHYAVEQRRAVAILCGEPGVGKTMLLENTLAQLPDFCSPIVKVVYPSMPPEQLLRYIVRQSGPHSDLGHDTSDCIELMDRFMRHNCAEEQHAVIAIDEAHLLSQQNSLETLRLLLNLASDVCRYESCMTLVLCGSTSLVSHISKYPSLEDRVSVRCFVERFTLRETIAYVEHRLAVCGVASVNQIFEKRSLESLQLYSTGVPRRINRICDLALMIGFAQESSKITTRIFDAAFSELCSARQAAA